MARGQISPGELSEAHKHLEGLSHCTDCHSIGNKVPDQKCLACHTTIRSLISRNRGYHVSRAVRSKACVDCHNEHHGRRFQLIRFDEENFDHNLTGYTLRGEHKVVDCRDCHKPDNIADSRTRQVEGTYLGLEPACLNCHEDFHQGTLAKNCTDCHNYNGWTPAPKFDHNRADFKLKGAHTKVDCAKCHKETQRNNRKYREFRGIAFSNCSSCHKDAHNGSFGWNCKKCHNESGWDRLNRGVSFDHDQTAFPLEQMHAAVDCRKCHTSGHYARPVKHDYCKNCHTDYHRQQFTRKNPSADCRNCHTASFPFSFTLYGVDEHQQSDFKLKGAHLATPCFVCHQQDNRWEFDLPGTCCVDCHGNIHRGKLDEKYYPNQDCTQCHNPGRWADVRFDHSLTGWKLEGRHSEISCRECHFEKEAGSDTIIQHSQSLSTDCTRCHDNVHGTQFEQNGVTDCKRCHSITSGWKPVNFNHNQTSFPLQGRHREIQCDACHKQKLFEDNIIRTEYKIQRFECKDCHSS